VPPFSRAPPTHANNERSKHATGAIALGSFAELRFLAELRTFLAPASPDRSRLDEIDWRILRALAADARLTNKAIAARLGIAESTCAYRPRALREAGVITGTKVQLALGALGYPIQAVVKVRLASHNREHVNRLYTDLTQVPGALQVLHVAGGDDFHLHVAVESAQALRDLVLEHVTVHRVVRQPRPNSYSRHETASASSPPPSSRSAAPNRADLWHTHRGPCQR
jgi:DNA-binding Lrp family transcriptional regulator